MNIRERLLKYPEIYSAYQSAVLRSGAKRRMVDEMFHAEPGARVLDIGCGLGDYAKFFSGRCQYVGIDHNELYIERARETWSDSGATFLIGDVADEMTKQYGPYDLAFISGVLHHIGDSAVVELARTIAPLLTERGRFVAVEPVFAPDQRLSARLIIAADRGRFVRDENGYRTLLQQGFETVTAQQFNGLYRIPYSTISLECAGAGSGP